MLECVMFYLTQCATESYAAYIRTEDLYIVHSVSQPGVVKVVSEGTLNSLNSTVKYEVSYM